jgi:galactose oxidase
VAALENPLLTPAASQGSVRHMLTSVFNRCVLSASLLASILLIGAISRAEVVRTGYTSIVAAGSGKCVDITGASMAPGATAAQWRCNFAPNEQWTVEPYNGSYRVIVQQSGQCLAVAGGSMSSGAQIVQNTCSGGNAELWSFVPVNGGFQMVSKNSGQCASVSGASNADAANIVQSPCSSASNFVWVFSSGLFLPSTYVDLQADHSGQCLNVSGASRSQGASVIQWPCAGAANEQWTLVPSGTAHQVISRNSGLCLAVSGGSTSSGAGIVQSTCGTSGDRLWDLRPVGRAYQLVAQNSNLCLNVSGASQSSGAQMIQSACGTAQSGLFSLSPAALPSSWTGVIPLSVNAIAVANLPNGRLLMWSANSQFSFEGDIGTSSGQTYTSVFDPSSGSSNQVLVTNTGDDMFCPGTANLFDGRILVNGGSSSPKTSIYDPATGNWTADARMNIPRGYEGDTVLSSGSVFTLGGSWSGGQGGKTAEIWSSGTGWRTLPSVTASPITGPDPQGVYRGDNHLWLFAVGNGQVFHAGPSAPMHWITTAGNGSITSPGNRGDDPYAINGNAVLYDVGMILKAGGAPAYQNANATTSSYVININGGASVTKVAPMAYRRAFSNGVVLPNGQVVIAGGQTFPIPFSDDTSIFIPEIWDPDTRVFRQLSPMQTPRNYHSTAILLPDGRVFVGGGGQCGSGCAANHLNAEILSPPYLFNADGSAATRPSITSAPTTATLGGTISVTTNPAVMSFVLMRLSSTTHTVNNDQRRVPVAIQSTSGSTYTLAIPSDAGTALRGYYMLFALSPRGVPSVAATLRVQ